jgi:hypothetical protein
VGVDLYTQGECPCDMPHYLPLIHYR